MTTHPGYEFEIDGKDGMRVRLPVAASSCQEVEAMNLPQLRNRINSLEMQAYGFYLRQIFDENPDLYAIRLENTDDPSDNGRHIGMLVEDNGDDDNLSALDDMLSERADYLNNAIRHRGIYDYIDNILDIGILSRNKIDQQLAKAYDATFEDQGAWDRLRASVEAEQLEHHTRMSSTSTSRPRM